MPFVILDPTADPESALKAYDDLDAHMMAKARFGDCDFAFAFIGDLNLPNYEGSDADTATVLVIVEKLPESGDDGDDASSDSDGDAAHEDGDDDDDEGEEPLTVLGFIFAEGTTQYDTDGVWKDALYFGRLADMIEQEEAAEDVR